MADERRQDDAARPQDESQKVHGDKLDPIIPRGADEGGGRNADPAGGQERAAEENDLTGDRGTGAR
jgi:hypothetical protein